MTNWSVILPASAVARGKTNFMRRKIIRKTYPQISLQPTIYSYTMDHTPSRFVVKTEYPKRHHSSYSSSANLSESIHYPTSRFSRQEPQRERTVSNLERKSKSNEAPTPKYKDGSTMKITNISMSPILCSDGPT